MERSRLLPKVLREYRKIETGWRKGPFQHRVFVYSDCCNCGNRPVLQRAGAAGGKGDDSPGSAGFFHPSSDRA